MPKKKIVLKKKTRVAAKASKAKRKTLKQQIDEFDWRNARKVILGDCIVAKEKPKRRR